MSLTELNLENFRNIAGTGLSPGRGFTLLYGANGSGKTSLLEAIWYLGHARSFRTRQPDRMIREGAELMRVTARVRTEGSDSAPEPLGLERQRGGEQRIRLGGQPVRSLAELVSCLPMQLLNQDSHRLIEGGPRERRQFLDWGVFHVEQGFYPAWQRYSRTLRQRNAALRAGARVDGIRVWDAPLAEAAQSIDSYRRAYVARLGERLRRLGPELVDLPPVALQYRSGWTGNRSFAESLGAHLEADLRQGFTQQGPHRADLAIRVGEVPARERISRGQQKQLVMALLLAQAEIHREATGRHSLFLIDDLPAELDRTHRARLIDRLQALESQVFVTANHAEDVPLPIGAAVFHVEQGSVRPAG